MLRTLLKIKSPKRIDTLVITDTASVLASDKVAIQRSWQPEWAEAKLLPNLALTIVHKNGKPDSPLDAALINYTSEMRATIPPGAAMVSYGFNATTAMSGNTWHHGREYELAIKGTPEAIMARCDLTESEREDILKMLAVMAADGHQVIAVAKGKVQSAPESLTKQTGKSKLAFAGLLSAGIKLLPASRQSVQKALHAGITVRVITGAHHETAIAIGRQLGLSAHRDYILDSRKLAHMNSEVIGKATEQTIIFTHASPKDKRYIAELLEKQHTIALANGDTTDFPALVRELVKTK